PADADDGTILSLADLLLCAGAASATAAEATRPVAAVSFRKVRRLHNGASASMDIADSAEKIIGWERGDETIPAESSEQARKVGFRCRASRLGANGHLSQAPPACYNTQQARTP